MGTDVQNKYAAPHVWNLVAKAIREQLEEEQFSAYGQATLLMLEQKFAGRFDEDEGFDRDDFLRKCGFNE